MTGSEIGTKKEKTGEFRVLRCGGQEPCVWHDADTGKIVVIIGEETPTKDFLSLLPPAARMVFRNLLNEFKRF
jgi:hypothetical protein